MPISTVCGDCQKSYTVKDDMAGKRFRCKDCQSIVVVPNTATEDEDDPFSGIDLQSTGNPVRKRRRIEEDDDNDDDDLPVQRPKRKSKAARKRKAPWDGTPVPIMIALGLQCLLTLYPAFSMLFVAFDNEMALNAKAGSYFMLMIRLTIAIIVLIFMLMRKDGARQVSRVLCCLALFLGGFAILLLIVFAPKNAYEVQLILTLGCQWAMWLTMMICLSTESAADWFSE